MIFITQAIQKSTQMISLNIIMRYYHHQQSSLLTHNILGERDMVLYGIKEFLN